MSHWCTGSDFKRYYVDDAPPFLGVWLGIIVDNLWHMAINHAVLTWHIHNGSVFLCC